MWSLYILLLNLIVFIGCCEFIYPIYNVTCNKDNHYDCGYLIGQKSKDRIKKYIDSYPNMQDLRICLLTGCSVDLRDLVFYNKAIWPQYYEEMEGIAAGADVDEMDIHLLTFKHEILSLRGIKEKVSEDQGSDLLLNEKGILRFESMIGHNEDGWIGMIQTGFFIHYKINDETEFISFNHPGSLIGHGFGFNKYGLAISMNILFPTNVTTQSRGIYWLNRAIYDAINISQAIQIINNYTNNNVCSYGISINLGFMDINNNNKITIANIEISNNNVSIQYYDHDTTVEDKSYGYHYDMYLRLNVNQQIDISSQYRLNRTQQLIQQNGTPKHKQDIFNILGDTQNTQYPIYRNGKSPDSAVTLATCLFDLHDQTMTVFENCNPMLCDPSFTLSFK